MYKLILFDVDGTLGKPKSGGDFRETADDWEFYPGRVAICQMFARARVKLVTVSNQGGVCFPWSKFTEEQICAVLDETARTIGAMASLVACSSTHPKALEKYRFDDPRRKPNPGMILEAKDLAGVELSEILMVGDRQEDEQAAKAAGVAFQWAEDFFTSSETKDWIVDTIASGAHGPVASIPNAYFVEEARSRFAVEMTEEEVQEIRSRPIDWDWLQLQTGK